MEEFLSIASKQISPYLKTKIIIAPHAGYSYSGSTAAFAYAAIDAQNVDTIFLLGPSHHEYLGSACALSSCSVYETPLGDIPLNTSILDRLERSSNAFKRMNIKTDTDEHSLEMHLPFIKKVMADSSFTLVPILVGSPTMETETNLAKVLAPYLENPKALFIISSDFCHWGERFRFTSSSIDIPIHESIKQLDNRGMELIAEKGIVLINHNNLYCVDHEGFLKYLEKTENTICGRYPILLMLKTLQFVSDPSKYSIEFVKYAQSSQVTDPRDSSVSYASAIVRKK